MGSEVSIKNKASNKVSGFKVNLHVNLTLNHHFGDANDSTIAKMRI